MFRLLDESSCAERMSNGKKSDHIITSLPSEGTFRRILTDICEDSLCSRPEVLERDIAERFSIEPLREAFIGPLDIFLRENSMPLREESTS